MSGVQVRGESGWFCDTLQQRMFQSERLNLKDAICLSLGGMLCLLLVLMLYIIARQHEAQRDLQRELAEQRILLDRVLEQSPALLQQSSNGAPSAAGESSTAHSSACRCVNRLGKPQQWQTAPDAELPSDFREGGTLRLAWSAEPATLTPFVSRDIYAEIVHQEVFEKLIWRDLDPPYDYVPGLAQSWRVSDDGRVVEFELFPNARFSDGTPVTADDVVFTFELTTDERIDAPIERALINEHVDGWEAIDAHTMRFRLKRAYYDAVGLCGNRLWILPRHVYGRFTAAQYNSISDVCIGSGPWTLGRWKRGSDIQLVRNDNYWGPKPPIEQLDIRFITGQRLELELFLAGEVDVIGPTSEQWLHYVPSAELAEVGRGVTYQTPLRGYTWIGFNLRSPMFDDARVRRALMLLVDRHELIDTLLGGLATIVTGPFHPSTPQYDANIVPLPYDPNEAARLLREIGWADTDNDGVLDRDLDGDGEREPFRFTFLVPSSELGRRVQRYVRKQFAEAGIDVQLDEMQWSAYLQRVGRGDFDVIMQRSNSAPEIDPAEFWHSRHVDGDRNLVGFQSPRADALIDAACAELDHDRRMELWHELHRLLHEQQPQMFLWTTPRLAFVNHRVQRVQPRSLRLYTSEWYITSEPPDSPDD